MSFLVKPTSSSMIVVSCSSKPSFNFYHLRTDFLSPNIRCRRLSLPCRKQSRKLALHARSLPFIIRASFYARFPSILVVFTVAVASFAVIRLFYLNYIRAKKETPKLTDHKDPDVLENLPFSEQTRSVTKKANIKSQLEDPGGLYMETVEDRKSTLEEAGCNKHKKKSLVLEEKQSSLEFDTTTSELEEPVIAELLQEPASKVFTSSSGYAGYPQGRENFDFAHPSVMPSERGVLEEAGTKSRVPGVMVEPTLSGSIVAMKDTDADINHGDEQNRETPGESELQVSSYNGLSGFVTEELYSFYEELHTFMSPYQGARTTFRSTLLNNNDTSLPARLRNLVANNFFGDTEVSPGGKPVASKQDPASKRKEYVRLSSFQRDGRLAVHGKVDQNLSRFLQSNEIHVKYNNDLSEYMRTYNCLLRDQRLLQCIELLESMDSKGLLDMDNIYHARFFKICKSKKAVREAFRFTKLIKKPTLSAFNMLLSVCAASQDLEGAFQVLLLVKKVGLKADSKLYTTLISTCAKSGKVDAMFEVFHEMVNAGIEPNVHTYGALIDGCAKAGQVAKAFGAYGIMRSKKVKPDRVIFNSLITACGRSGAVDRAFDVLAEMRAEPQPIDPDHFTLSALMKTCAQAGQIERVYETYKMINQYNIKGTPEVYTIAVNSLSRTGDLEFVLNIYSDMERNGVFPDEMFISALIAVAGHAGKVDIAFEILQHARMQGIQLGNIAYSSLMGACSNGRNWQKALELYEDIKGLEMTPTVSTLNALITSLCHGDQLQKSVEVFAEMKEAGVCPNAVTYSILLATCEKKDALELGIKLFLQAKEDGVFPNLIMGRCLTSLCLQKFEKASSHGEPVLSFSSGKPQIDNKWTSSALMIYREMISAGVVPSIEAFSQVLGCLRFPHDASLRNRLIENLGLSGCTSLHSNLYSLLDGFGEYDPRSFSLLEEAASIGVVPYVSFRESPIIIDARKLVTHSAEVYLLTVLKGLKHRFAAGAKLPNITILLPVERTRFISSKGDKTVNLAGRVGQAVGALLRRVRLPYHGKESLGKIRINSLALRRWFQPMLVKPISPFDGRPTGSSTLPTTLAKGIASQRRSIRTSDLSLEISQAPHRPLKCKE